MVRFLSICVSILYVCLAYVIGAVSGVLAMLIFLALPLACIWFPAEMGSYIGFLRHHRKSPGVFVHAMGSVLLVLPAAMWVAARYGPVSVAGAAGWMLVSVPLAVILLAAYTSRR